MTLRVLIADDHTLFRQGLVGILETREDLVQVVGQAATGHEAVLLAEQLQPDIILMDIYMPECDGLTATKEIRARFPQCKIVMLTSSESDEHLYQAVQLGASGYLLKNLNANRFFEMLAGVMRGEPALTPDMAARLLKGVANHTALSTRGVSELSDRELAVLRLIAVGATNQEIAEQLFLSIHTVKNHVHNILDKLKLENRTQVASFALNKGLIPPKDKSGAA